MLLTRPSSMPVRHAVELPGETVETVELKLLWGTKKGHARAARRQDR